MSRVISYGLYFDWNKNGTFASDENEANYLLSVDGDESIANPDESAFASTGYTTEITMTMINKGQRYSPTNTTGPYYSVLSNGGFYQIPVRLIVQIDGVSFTIFTGKVKSIIENPRTYKGIGLVVFRCSTDDGILINKKVETPIAYTTDFYVQGMDEGRLIAKTLYTSGLQDGVDYISQDYPGNPVVDIPSIAQGMFTIPWYWLDSESPIEDCWKLAAACGGRFFFDVKRKMYTYHNMSMYGTVTESSTSQFTINESNSESVKPIYNDKELYSKIKVTAKPRAIGFTQTLWESEDIPRLAPGETITIWAKLNNPVYQYSEPAYTWDATTTSGFSRNSDISISAIKYSQAIKFTVTNSGSYHVFLRNFKVSGRPIEGGENYVYEKDSNNTSYWTNKNGKERSIDNPYIQTPAQAQALGDMLAGRQGNFGERYEVKGFKGTVFLKVGDRVTIVNSTLGISKDAIITKSSWSLSEGSFYQDLECFSTSYIYPLPNTDYFKIGTNSHNSAKKFFY